LREPILDSLYFTAAHSTSCLFAAAEVFFALNIHSDLSGDRDCGSHLAFLA